MRKNIQVLKLRPTNNSRKSSPAVLYETYIWHDAPMAIAAPSPSLPETIVIAPHEQTLGQDIADYLNQLAAQSPREPLILSIKIHPLNIADGLAHELAAHERRFLARGEKDAAHEFADPYHPLENAVVRHELCALIAEMVAPLAEATFAHHLWFLIALGKNLSPPFAADRLGICASFDARHSTLRQRFALERETAAPASEPRVAAGMTLVCEPLESGYYRLPDDKRYRNASGLLLSDPLYRWTLRAVLMYHMAMADFGRLAADERESLGQLGRQIRSFFRLLAIGHPEMRYLASLSGVNMLLYIGFTPADIKDPATQATPDVARAPQPVAPKIVFGRFASAGGAVQPRNVEHSAAGMMTERQRPQSQRTLPHAHLPGTELQPE